MNADNSHAERQILRRVLDSYDQGRGLGAEEHIARQVAVLEYSRLARLDYVDAAERVADALARRAASKLTLIDGGK